MRNFPPSGVPDTVIIRPRYYSEEELDWFAAPKDFILPDGTIWHVDGIDIRKTWKRMGGDPKKIPKDAH